ncbi:hypothetical protein PC121_g21002 [Phytophthora cactorum]|nr:hypothetical protein PC120_g25977 [Phytophthora cactorum]KAG3045898.1 hypothetical protein PC121_g21002 [Phytophthora cactorum]
MELFTGLQRPTSLRVFYLPDGSGFQEVPANEPIDQYLVTLHGSARSMHRAVDDKRIKERLLNKKKEPCENLTNLTVGDYVLRSRVDERLGNKLQVLGSGRTELRVSTRIRSASSIW